MNRLVFFCFTVFGLLTTIFAQYHSIIDKVMLGNGMVQKIYNQDTLTSTSYSMTRKDNNDFMLVAIDSLPITTNTNIGSSIVRYNDSCLIAIRAEGSTSGIVTKVFIKNKNGFNTITLPSITGWISNDQFLSFSYLFCDYKSNWHLGNIISNNGGESFYYDREIVIPAENGYWTKFISIADSDHVDLIYTVQNQGLIDSSVIPNKGYYTRYYSNHYEENLLWEMHGYYVVETANSFYQTNKEASVLIYDSTYFWGSVSDGEYSGIVSPSGYKIGNQKNGTYYNVLPDTGMGTIAIKYCQGKYSIVGNQYDGTERIIFDLPLNSSQIYSLQRVINKYVIQLSGSRWLISDDNMQTHHDYSFNDGEYLFLVEDGRILLVKNEIVYELKENSISSYSVVTKDDLSFNLHQNYPNPFNPITNISFSLPNSSQVQLKIYDILGKEVTTLINEEKTAGNYQITFDGGKLTSGTYFYKLSAGSYTAIKKMVLMK